MIVVDVSVLVALLDREDALHPDAQRLLAEHVDEVLVVHVITRAEVLVGPARAGRLDLVEPRLDDVGVRTVQVAAGDGAALATMRARTGLRLPDCCVLLAARQRSAAVATFDARLARQAGALGLTVLR